MKYTEIKVKPFVSVSSSYDYFVDVLFKENGQPIEPGRFFCKRFHLNSEHFLLSSDKPGYDVSMPAYARREVLSQLKNMIEDGSLKPYEYRRDGSKRWEDLRYYDANDLKEAAEKWPTVTAT